MLLYGPVDGYLLLLKDDWCFDYFPPNKYMYYLVKIKPVVLIVEVPHNIKLGEY